MAEIKAVKTKDDLVRLINTGLIKNKEGKVQDVQVQYDGVPYTIAAGKEILVKREIAEHCKKKSHSYALNVYGLDIQESPFNQVPAGQVPAIMEESAKLKATVDELIKEIEIKDKRIALLEGEVDEMRSAKREERKPGRPKGS